MDGNPYYYFWDADFDKYENARKQLIQDTERLKAQNKVSEHNAKMDKLNKLEPEVNAVVSVTNKIRNKTGLLCGYNPLVYNVVQNVMLYSALFRYIKNEFPETWKEYINKVETSFKIVDIKTPNIWRK